MSLLRRVWLYVVGALGSAVLVLGLLWRRAARERDQAQAERDAAQQSSARTEGVRDSEIAIEAVHRTAGEIVAAKREQVEAAHAEARAETDAALDVDELARVETARRRRREAR